MFFIYKENIKPFFNLLIVSILFIPHDAHVADTTDNKDMYSSEELSDPSIYISHPNNPPKSDIYTDTFNTNTHHPVGLRGVLWNGSNSMDDEINDKQKLQLKLCRRRCSDVNCIFFETPIETCFNGRTLFPNDIDYSWGPYDIYDRLMYHPYNQRIAYFQRYFFPTRDSSCAQDEKQNFSKTTKKEVPIDLSKATDIYKLPLDECVGPFGEPRPWGEFELMNMDDFQFNSKKYSSSLETE